MPEREPDQVVEIATAPNSALIYRLSGDYNPIHLHGATARLFGFRAPIAHGMWSLGRGLAGLRQFLRPPYEVRARFRRPLLLPAEVCLLLDEGEPTAFSIVDTKTNKAYLTGSIA